MKNIFLLILILFSFDCFSIERNLGSSNHVDIIRYKDNQYEVFPAGVGCYDSSTELCRGIGLDAQTLSLINIIKDKTLAEAVINKSAIANIYYHADKSTNMLFYRTHSIAKLRIWYDGKVIHTKIAGYEYIKKYVFGVEQVLALAVYMAILCIVLYFSYGHSKWAYGSTIKEYKKKAWNDAKPLYALCNAVIVCAYFISRYTGIYENPYNLFVYIFLIYNTVFWIIYAYNLEREEVNKLELS